MDHQVVHFEIPATDVEKLRRFYSDLFGWGIEATQFPGFFMISTGGSGIGGAIMQRQSPQHAPMNFVSVESVEDYAKKVTQLGGQVVMGKTPVPKMGYFAVCLDPEGNPVGLWEMDTNAG